MCRWRLDRHQDQSTPQDCLWELQPHGPSANQGCWFSSVGLSCNVWAKCHNSWLEGNVRNALRPTLREQTARHSFSWFDANAWKGVSFLWLKLRTCLTASTKLNVSTTESGFFNLHTQSFRGLSLLTTLECRIYWIISAKYRRSLLPSVAKWAKSAFGVEFWCFWFPTRREDQEHLIWSSAKTQDRHMYFFL